MKKWKIDQLIVISVLVLLNIFLVLHYTKESLISSIFVSIILSQMARAYIKLSNARKN